MKLTIYHKDNPNKPLYRSSGSEIIIGRPKDMPIHLDLSPDLKVSRPHAHLYYSLSTWWVEDLGSKYGTFLNNKKIVEATPLSPDDELRLGDTELRLAFVPLETQFPTELQLESHTPVDEIEPPRTISEDKRTELLAKFSEIAASSSPGEAMLARFLEEIGGIFPQSERRSIVMIDEDKELIPRASWPAGPAQFSFSLARRAIKSQEALHWVRDVTGGEKRATSLFDTTTALCVPMMFNGRVMGVVYVDSTKPEGTFSEAERDLLSEIANVMAGPIKAADSNTLPSFPSVFIAYAPPNRELVDRLAADLRRRRVKVWFDERLQVGDDRQQVITTAIKSTAAFVPIVTTDSLVSAQVQSELATALSKGKKIFPLLCETNELPPAIERLVPLDIGPGQYQESLEALVEAIYKIPDLPTSPVSADISPLEGQEIEQPPPDGPAISRSEQQKSKELPPNRILILAANPRNTDQLRLDEEARTIEERLRMAKFGNRFELVRHGAVRYTDLSEYLLRHTPQIVHFSGHGNKSGKVILEDETGMGQTVTDDALRQLFRLFKDDIRCVVLNACLTASQAEAIIQEIHCVVGMSEKIGDQAAIRFAGGFYRALGYGRSVEFAYNLGRNEMGLAKLDKETTPQLFVKKGVNPANIIFD
jgi:hypothetical protein